MKRSWGLVYLLLSCTAVSGQTVAISGPAGTYQITLPSTATITQTGNSVVITWGMPGPQPPVPPPQPPQPPPGPTPLLPVTPQSVPLSVIAVFDRSGRSIPTSQAAIQTSGTIAAALKGLNATWISADVTTKTIENWVKDARAAGIPALLVMVMGTGKKALAFEAIPLPVDEPGVIAEIKRIRGIGGGSVSPSPQMTRVVELLTEVQATLRRSR